MILLDTNVVSEAMRADAAPAVVTWLDRQAAETLYLSATVLSELRLGIELLPEGRRKDDLSAGLRKLLDRLFAGRVLPFEEQAAERYALMVAGASARGKAIPVADGQIAAVAAVHGLAVATRDTSPFMAAGVRVINPWE